MSEMLRRAGEARAAQAASANTLALSQAAAAEKQRRLQRESAERAREFVGHMQANEVSTTPLYVEEYNRVPGGIMHPRSVPSRARKLGDGWLVRPESYDYDTGSTCGLFLTNTGELYECGDLQTTASQGFSIPETEGHYRVSGMKHVGELGDHDQHTIFAGEAGMGILANGLAMHGITE